MPIMSAAIQPAPPAHFDEDAFGLPGWIYRDPAFFELRRQMSVRLGHGPYPLNARGAGDIPKVREPARRAVAEAGQR